MPNISFSFYLLAPLAPSQATAPATSSANRIITDTETMPVEAGIPAFGIGVDVTGVLVGVVVAVEVGQEVGVGRRVGVEVGNVGVGVKAGRMVNC
jgi:hypothetical protein